MRNRLLFGPVLIAIVCGIAWLDEAMARQTVPAFLSWLFGDRGTFPPGMVLAPVMGVLVCLAAIEVAGILRSKGIACSRRVSCVCAIIGLAVSVLVPASADAMTGVAVVAATAAAVMLGSMIFFARGRTTQGLVAATGGALLAFVYLGLMPGFVLAIRREHSAWVVLAVVLVIKSSDIGAYFTGRSIGRHKLIPWLSPGKTWEGFFGGAAFAAIVGTGAGWALAQAGITPLPPLWAWALAGVIFACAGQVGDLMASVLKRDAGLKDSGRLLPGFGGLLDVLDSPLLVAPVAFWWLRATVGVPAVVSSVVSADGPTLHWLP